ncbi:hypothetical protein ACPA9J_32380 [Pseudomonas aeruginosa]
MNTTVIPPSLLDVDFLPAASPWSAPAPAIRACSPCAPGPCCNRPRWWSTTAWSPAS